MSGESADKVILIACSERPKPLFLQECTKVGGAQWGTFGLEHACHEGEKCLCLSAVLVT